LPSIFLPPGFAVRRRPDFFQIAGTPAVPAWRKFVRPEQVQEQVNACRFNPCELNRFSDKVARTGHDR
jgi:hypothetical protein